LQIVARLNAPKGKTMETIRYSFPLKKNIPLRPLRKALGMSREELAVQLGVSYDSVGRWERNGGPINKSALKHLERLIVQRGVTSQRFLVDADPDQPKPVTKTG